MNTGHSIATFSDAAATYNREGPRFFSHFARQLVAFADMRGNEDVLDVATGTALVLLEAAKRIERPTRFVGIDLSEAMLARAAVALEREGLRWIELEVMDAESLSLRDESFDLVFCAFAFSSFSDQSQAIREFIRVLRPGGKVCISDAPGWYFDRDPRWSWHRELLAPFSARPTEPLPRPRPSAVADLLEANGLADVVLADESHDLVFRDEGEWWRWSWSHGVRGLLDAIPEPDRDVFRDAAFAKLRELKSLEGSITATMHATFARGSRLR